MNNAMYAAATGSRIEQHRLEVIANNLANMQTTGFKEDKAYFAEVLQFISDEKFDSERKDAFLTRALSSSTNFRPGPVHVTGNQFDAAINGNGFFVVETDQGEAYTRDGAFKLDLEGRLVTTDGRTVMGEGGEIVVGNGTLEISSTGNVLVNGVATDKLRIAAFENPRELKKLSANTFINEGRAQEVEEPEYFIVHKALESSNVNPVRAMSEMVQVGRTFEAYQRIISLMDDINERAAQLGKL